MSPPSEPSPKPRPRWGRRIFIIFSVLIVGVVLIGFGAVIAVKRFLHSDKFRTLVEVKASEFLHADGEFAAFNWAETSVYSDGFSAEGYEDAAFSKLAAEGLRAEINLDAAKQGVWEVSGLDVHRLTATIGGPRLPSPEPLPVEVAPVPEEEAAGGAAEARSAPGIFSRFIPRKFALEEMRVRELQLSVVDTGADPVELRGMQLTVRPRENSDIQIVGTGGTITAGSYPELAIDEILVKTREDTIFIDHCDGTFYDGAVFTATGKIDKAESPVDLALKVDFSSLDAEKVLKEDWSKKLSGRFSGTVNVNGPASPAGATRISGDLRLRDGVLVSLPVLDTIADWSGTDNFRRINLSKAEVSFTRQGESLTIPKLEIESTGLARLEGTMTVTGEVIDGTFQLGITPGTFRWIPGAEQKVFNREENGFKWTTVRVSGTVDEIEEDLSGRLVSGAVDSVIEGVIDMVPKDGKDAVEKTEDIIRRGADFLRGFLEGTDDTTKGRP